MAWCEAWLDDLLARNWLDFELLGNSGIVFESILLGFELPGSSGMVFESILLGFELPGSSGVVLECV
jgi:hypothetical protein